MKLYVGCEDVDSYYRDGCVFREDVDIYDTMSALVKYSNGVTMTYALNAFMPFEGYRVAFNGEKGRLEVRDHERQPWKVEPTRTKRRSISRRASENASRCRCAREGGHGGGDTVFGI